MDPMIRGKGQGEPIAKKRRVNLPAPLVAKKDEYEEYEEVMVEKETEEELEKVRDLKAQPVEVKVEEEGKKGPTPIFEDVDAMTAEDFKNLTDLLESPTESPSQGGGGTPDPFSDTEQADEDLGMRLRLHSHLQALSLICLKKKI